MRSEGLLWSKLLSFLSYTEGQLWGRNINVGHGLEHQGRESEQVWELQESCARLWRARNTLKGKGKKGKSHLGHIPEFSSQPHHSLSATRPFSHFPVRNPGLLYHLSGHLVIGRTGPPAPPKSPLPPSPLLAGKGLNQSSTELNFWWLPAPEASVYLANQMNLSRRRFQKMKEKIGQLLHPYSRVYVEGFLLWNLL